MKKLILTLFLGALMLSCSSDSSSDSGLSETPTAKSEYDSNSYGIYKGIFVGSTGYIVININNEGSLSATLTINGSSSTYTTTETAILNSSIEGLTFSNGSSSFDFNVDYNGSSPNISNINISGHPNAEITVIKERSTAIVKCYQGTYSGDDAGTLNLVISEGVVYGLAKSNSDGFPISLNGLKTENTVAGTFEGGTFSGTASGNRITGNWENDSAESGSWSANRKL